MKTKGQAAQAADQAIASYQRQGEELQRQSSAASAAAQTAVQQFRETIAELAAVLLPHAEAEYLKRVEAAIQATILVGTRTSYEQRRPVWAQRLAELEKDSEFQQREVLLTPPHGKLLVEFARLLEQKKRVDQRLCELERSRNLLWMLKRIPDPDVPKTALHSFWRAITLAETREKRAQAAAAKELGYATWADLYSDYQHHSTQVLELGNQVVAVTQRRENLQTLVAEHLDLGEWLHNFEARLTRQLQSVLAEHLTRSDLRSLHSQLTGHYQLLAARADALKYKRDYLENIVNFLEKEISDRNTRSYKIRQVQRLWQRRPSERLGKDQSKWLVAGPQAKFESTRKQLVWLSTLVSKVGQFSDYLMYSRYLLQDPKILAYDVFGFGTPDRMPYEGFTQLVFSSLRKHRAATRQKGPDYSGFKQWDREERSRLRKLEREQEREQARHREPDYDYDTDNDSDNDNDWREEEYFELEESEAQEKEDTYQVPAEAVAAGVLVVGVAAAEIIAETMDSQMGEGS